MMPRDMFLRTHLMNTGIIVIINSGRGIYGGLGDVLLRVW